MSDYNKNGGPRTPEGRAKSALNATKHGLAGNVLIIHGEDPAEFDALVERFNDDFQPQTNIEATMVHDLAKFHWFMERAMRLQTQAWFSLEAMDPRHLALMIRYQNSNHNAFQRTLKSLQATQKERLKEERQSVSKEPRRPIFHTYDKDGYVIPDEDEIHLIPKECLRPPDKIA